jgi:hypothetical protein
MCCKSKRTFVFRTVTLSQISVVDKVLQVQKRDFYLLARGHLTSSCRPQSQPFRDNNHSEPATDSWMVPCYSDSMIIGSCKNNSKA